MRCSKLGFSLMATSGTHAYLSKIGLDVERINKVQEGRPHCEDAILNGQVQLVINTTEGAQAILDSYSIRRSSLTSLIPYFTTVNAASAAIEAINALRTAAPEPVPLQDYFQSTR